MHLSIFLLFLFSLCDLITTFEQDLLDQSVGAEYSRCTIRETPTLVRYNRGLIPQMPARLSTQSLIKI